MNLRIIFSSIVCLIVFSQCEIVDENAPSENDDQAYWTALKKEVKINDQQIASLTKINNKYDQKIKDLKSETDAQQRLIEQQSFNEKRASELVRLLTFKIYREKRIFDKKWRTQQLEKNSGAKLEWEKKKERLEQERSDKETNQPNLQDDTIDLGSIKN